MVFLLGCPIDTPSITPTVTLSLVIRQSQPQNGQTRFLVHQKNFHPFHHFNGLRIMIAKFEYFLDASLDLKERQS